MGKIARLLLGLLLVICILFSISHEGLAQTSDNPVNIDIRKVMDVAKTYCLNTAKIAGDSKSEVINLSLAETKKTNDTVLFYVFNINEKDGYIIMSANENVPPVLGYTTEGNYSSDPNYHSPAYKAWLSSYNLQIKHALQKKIKNNKAASIWSDILGKGTKNAMELVLLNLKTQWGQAIYYNNKCPPTGGIHPDSPTGYNGHTYAGCVATAMAQVLKYYEWPSKGYGYHTYFDPINLVPFDLSYGTLAVNYSGIVYDWKSMSHEPFVIENAINELIYDCGVSVNMDYSYSGSGASISDIPEAIYNHFDYAFEAKYIEKKDYPVTWEMVLMDEIIKERPIIYRGTGDGNHAFICNGYKSESSGTKFYFNWGLEKRNNHTDNGWFLLSCLGPVDFGTSIDYFTSDQAAVINIHPSQQPDLTFMSGSVSQASIISGNPFNVSFSIKNTGTQTADTSTAKIYLSNSPIYGNNDIYLGSVLIESLVNSQITTKTLTFNSSTLPVGSYYILISADGNRNVHEFIETDNIYSIPITINNPGQLIISSVQLNKQVFSPGETATITVTLTNQLTGASVNFKVDNGSVVNCSEVGNGIYQKTFLTPTTPGSHTVLVNASKAGSINANPYSFTFLIANAGLTLTANPTTIQYTGSSTSLITATLLNPQGQPVPGVTINFMMSPTGGLSQGAVVTNTQGIASTSFIPDNTGLFTIDATAQTTNSPTGSAQVRVNSAGSSTYTIRLTSSVQSRSATSVTYDLNPYAAFSSSGLPVEYENFSISTTLGTFQNGTQSVSSTIGGGSYGAGYTDPHPLLTSTTGGIATITITVGPTIATFNLQVTPGLLPQIQPFYSLSDAKTYADAEHELDWSFDGKMLAYTPGKIIAFPSFSTIYGGPTANTYSLSFSKTAQNLIMGRISSNPVFYIYNTNTNLISSFSPSNVTMYTVAWSDENDDYRFAVANATTGYMNQIIIYTGSGLIQTYLYIDETSDLIRAMDWKGSYLSLVTSTGKTYLFNTSTMTRMWKSTVGTGNKYGVSISHDKTKLAVIGRKYTTAPINLLIYNIGSSTPLFQYSFPTSADYYSVDWAGDGSKLVCAGSNGYAKILDVNTGSEIFDLNMGTTEDIRSVKWSSQDIVAAMSLTTVKFFAPFDTDGPLITIGYPGPGFSTTYDTVHIKGSVKDLTGIQTAEYKLNSDAYLPLAFQQDGSFDQIITLVQGSNEIKIRAFDRIGNMTEISRNVTHIDGLLEVNTGSVQLGSGIGSSGTIAITSNLGWTISNNDSWLNINPIFGSLNQTVIFTANSTNPSTASTRSAVVTISGTGVISKTVTVNQDKLVVLTSATTSDAIIKSPSNVTLKGSVNANNSTATVAFEYGTTVAYGQAITAIQNPVIGAVATTVNADISGLEINKLYHFRVKATNSAGTVFGNDKTFIILITGVEKFDIKDVIIYPNPTYGSFTIKGIDNCDLSLFDIAGRPILKERVYKNNTIINLTGKPKGIYVLVLKKDNQIIYRRIALM